MTDLSAEKTLVTNPYGDTHKWLNSGQQVFTLWWESCLCMRWIWTISL